MRKLLMLMTVVGGVAAVHSNSDAAPANGAALAPVAQENPLIQQAAVYCVNRYSGRILYRGYCARRVVYRRFYCVNRYGRFLHWGRCYR